MDYFLCNNISFQCGAVKKWITDHSGNLRQAGYNRALKVFSGQDIDGMLFQIGVSPLTLHEFQVQLTDLELILESYAQGVI